MKAVKYNRRIERGTHSNGKESLLFFNAFIDLIEHLSVEVNDIDSSNSNVVDLRLERMFSGQQSLRGIKDAMSFLVYFDGPNDWSITPSDKKPDGITKFHTFYEAKDDLKKIKRRLHTS